MTIPRYTLGLRFVGFTTAFFHILLARPPIISHVLGFNITIMCFSEKTDRIVLVKSLQSTILGFRPLWFFWVTSGFTCFYYNLWHQNPTSMTSKSLKIPCFYAHIIMVFSLETSGHASSRPVATSGLQIWAPSTACPVVRHRPPRGKARAGVSPWHPGHRRRIPGAKGSPEVIVRACLGQKSGEADFIGVYFSSLETLLEKIVIRQNNGQI